MIQTSFTPSGIENTIGCRDIPAYMSHLKLSEESADAPPLWIKAGVQASKVQVQGPKRQTSIGLLKEDTAQFSQQSLQRGR